MRASAILVALAAIAGPAAAADFTLLEKLDLVSHRESLAAAGVRSDADLRYLTDADLQDLGLPLVHRRLVQWELAHIDAVAATPVRKMGDTPRRLSDDDASAASALAADLDTLWLMLGAFLVFLMQAGFALLEVGSVRVKNTKNILVKNVFDASIGAITFWLFGYGLALGEGSSFVGSSDFAFADTFQEDTAGLGYNGPAFALWLFQFAFAATAATIVSGAVAERVSFQGYMIYATVLTSIVYPVVAHWGWSSDGWASAFRSDGDLLFGVGVIDFAGSGVVHMVGGVAALWAAYFIGPRHGRFATDGTPIDIAQQNAVYQTLGTLILWFGWYGFNCASTLALSGGASGVAAKVGVTTTIAAATGGLTSIAIGMYSDHILDCGAVNNGILAGLVGVTSACATVEPEGAAIIGVVAAFVYNGFSRLLLRFQIDDVVDAAPVHLGCGLWGVIAAGLFSSSNSYRASYGAESCGLFYGCDHAGDQFAANLVFALAVFAWTSACCVPLFWGIKQTVGLRASLEHEIKGMDEVKHGGLTMQEFERRGSGTALQVKPAKKKTPAVQPADRNPEPDEESMPMAMSPSAQKYEVEEL